MITKPIITDETGEKIANAILATGAQAGEVKELKEKTQDLQNQIDSLPEGTTIDEVVLARQSPDGTSFPNLKSRLDTQYLEITSDINNQKSSYIMDKDELSDYIKQGFINTNNTITERTDYITFYNVPVYVAKKYVIYHSKTSSSTAMRYVFVNANLGGFGGGIHGAQKETSFTVPENALYISFSVFADDPKAYLMLKNFNADTSVVTNEIIPKVEYKLNVTDNALRPFYNFDLNFTDGGFINNDGDVSELGGWSYTDFIEIGKATKITVPCYYGSGARICLYDKNNQKTRSFANEGSTGDILEIEINNNEKYIRISCYSQFKEKVYISTNILDVLINEEEKGNDEYNVKNIAFIDGAYIQQDGTPIERDAYSYTDYINISAFKKIKFPAFYQTGARACFYDMNKGFISPSIDNPSYGQIMELEVPNQAVFIRITLSTSRKEDFYVHGLMNIEDKVYELASFNDESPNINIIHDGGMAKIFKTIGVVGDSLSSGAMVYNGSGEISFEGVDMYEYSWIQYMARYCGTTAFNFSSSGLSTRTFLSNTKGCYSKMHTEGNECQAYFIALGHNDKNQSIPVGTPADINKENPSESGNTYYGCYARIIMDIKTIVPDAKIFCICMKNAKNDPTFAEYNEAIKYMATTFDNVYILDMHEYFPFLGDWEYTNGHGNAMGYLNYSYQISTYVDWIIRHNPDEFKFVQFIGTDYPY